MENSQYSQHIERFCSRCYCMPSTNSFSSRPKAFTSHSIVDILKKPTQKRELQYSSISKAESTQSVKKISEDGDRFRFCSSIPVPHGIKSTSGCSPVLPMESNHISTRATSPTRLAIKESEGDGFISGKWLGIKSNPKLTLCTVSLWFFVMAIKQHLLCHNMLEN